MERNILSLQSSIPTGIPDVSPLLATYTSNSKGVATDNNSNNSTDNNSNNSLVLNTDLLIIDEDFNRIAVRITAEDIDEVTPFLNNLRFEILGSSPEHNLIEGYIPFDALSDLEALDEEGLIIGVVPLFKPIVNVGDTDSQADFVHETDRVREALPTGYDGAGQTIAVFSDSYNVSSNGSAAADIASGDLPGSTNPLGRITPINVLLEGDPGGTDEGRAMLQLVHDLAPGANLAFAAFRTPTEAAQQVRDAANPAIGNADVLVDDITFFEEPVFQDGLVAQAVDDVVINDGVTYFSSAGNRSDNSYESTNINFTADSGGTFSNLFYDFDPTAGIDSRQDITLENGQSFLGQLQWDDPWFTMNGVDTDLLFAIVDSSDTVVAIANSNNITNQTPVEILGFTNNTGSTQNYEVVITNEAGPNPGRIKYISFRTHPTEYDTNSSTVVSHHAATNAQAVAAIPFFDQDTPEPFTSEGPTTILFEPDGTPLAMPEIRQTPDIAAIDGTNTTFFPLNSNGQPNDIGLDVDSFPNFFGTSAAAPHAAAVAALVQQANPSFTPQQVYSRLQSTAEDITPAGFDNVTGFGLINAYDAIFGSPVPATLPFSENFDDGDLPLAFETNTNGAGRIQVTSENSPLGVEQLTLDSSRLGGLFSLNEAILHIDTTGFTDITLSFEQKEFGDEDNAMSATFVGSENSDGVALSVDGTNWFELVDLTGSNSTSSFQTNVVDLSSVAATNGLTLGSDVQIKFQQFDDFVINAPTGSDGFAFDNISVSGTAIGICNPTTGDDNLTSCATSRDDSINGLAGNDTIVGGDGNDTLIGGADADILRGQGDNDSLLGSIGNDTLIGGVGEDILRGQNDNDSLLGSDGDDTLIGGAGEDILRGQNDNDSLLGSNGDDTLNGGAGEDILRGQNDNDSLLGSNGDDTLNGGADDDILFGQNDNDSLLGGDGNDTLNGGANNDILRGQNHNDILLGGSGDDTLVGENGIDRMNGGTGSDRFRLESTTFANRDVIQDFEDEIDRFELSEGLSFGDLTILQPGINTIIRETATNQTIAIVSNIDAADITMDDFV